MTKEQIKALIVKKLVGQGNQVDLGSALPAILEGIVDDLIKDFASPITYAELKALRDAGELIPGMRYRITDYVATTTQEGTRSANHPFDIIVVADSANTLNENATAIQHDGDEYFANSDLAAWKLKYCLDNDSTRFIWAQQSSIVGSIEDTELPRYPSRDVPSLGLFAWHNEDQGISAWTKTETPEVGTECFNDEGELTGETVAEVKEAGKGVIFKMVDEFDNEASFDFKSILFKRDMSKLNPTQEAEDVYCYTFSCFENGLYEGEVPADETIITRIIDSTAICRNNSIAPFYIEGKIALNNIVIYTDYETWEFRHYENNFSTGCKDITIGSECTGNKFGPYCSLITMGDVCKNNTFGSTCSTISLTQSVDNTFGDRVFNFHLGEGSHSNIIRCTDSIQWNGSGITPTLINVTIDEGVVQLAITPLNDDGSLYMNMHITAGDYNNAGFDVPDGNSPSSKYYKFIFVGDDSLGTFKYLYSM